MNLTELKEKITSIGCMTWTQAKPAVKMGLGIIRNMMLRQIGRTRISDNTDDET